MTGGGASKSGGSVSTTVTCWTTSAVLTPPGRGSAVVTGAPDDLRRGERVAVGVHQQGPEGWRGIGQGGIPVAVVGDGDLRLQFAQFSQCLHAAGVGSFQHQVVDTANHRRPGVDNGQFLQGDRLCTCVVTA
jgi:hypothetical protein